MSEFGGRGPRTACVFVRPGSRRLGTADPGLAAGSEHLPRELGKRGCLHSRARNDVRSGAAREVCLAILMIPYQVPSDARTDDFYAHPTAVADT